VKDDIARTAAAELLTLEEAAAALRTPVATLRYWRHLGVGPDGFRLGHRVVYRRQDVERWVTERQRAQSPRRETGPRAALQRRTDVPTAAQSRARGSRLSNRRRSASAVVGLVAAVGTAVARQLEPKLEHTSARS
jgi:hypothetical protein